MSPGDFPASNLSARPKSAMQAVRFHFSRTFLLLKSLKRDGVSPPVGQDVCGGSEPDVPRGRCVPVSDGRLVSVLVSRYVFVQVGETPRHGLSDETQVRPGQDVGLQVVGQRSLNTPSFHSFTKT